MTTWKVLLAYGLFLLAAGIAGFLSNPEKAKTALLSGGIFGALCLGLAALSRIGYTWPRPAAIALLAFLAAVFAWRAWVTWQKFADGEPKLLTASLISAMLAATLIALPLLFFGPPPPQSLPSSPPAPPESESQP